MKVAVIDFPGPNGVKDIEAVCHMFGHDSEVFGPKDTSFKDADSLIIPGGYSYGDVIRPSALSKTCQVCGAISRFAKSGKPLLGIGNGFQLLCELGLLPGVLIHNPTLDFSSGIVGVEVQKCKGNTLSSLSDKCLNLPIACYYGQYYIDKRTTRILAKNEQVAMRYSARFGVNVSGDNFLGSVGNIAAVFNEAKNVLGMMVHPERVIGLNQDTKDGYLFFKVWFDLRNNND